MSTEWYEEKVRAFSATHGEVIINYAINMDKVWADVPECQDRRDLLERVSANAPRVKALRALIELDSSALAELDLTTEDVVAKVATFILSWQVGTTLKRAEVLANDENSELKVLGEETYADYLQGVLWATDDANQWAAGGMRSISTELPHSPTLSGLMRVVDQVVRWFRSHPNVAPYL